MASKTAINLSKRLSNHPSTTVLKPTHIRHLSTTLPRKVNPLLNLSHFSASKEAQFLSREKKVPREEFHPHLQLIRSSEVDPFAPSPGASPTVIAALKRAQQGQSDIQTAYTLAIHNLIAQVQLARKEAVAVQMKLDRVTEKYNRDERNGMFVMVCAVVILAFVATKTDALEDLKEYAEEVKGQWRGFDWEWLGNPPSHKFAAASTWSEVGNGRAQGRSRPIEVRESETQTKMSPVIGMSVRPIETWSDPVATTPTIPATSSDIITATSPFQTRLKHEPKSIPPPPSPSASWWLPTGLFWSSSK